jgi:hypothetical protein
MRAIAGMVRSCREFQGSFRWSGATALFLDQQRPAPPHLLFQLRA